MQVTDKTGTDEFMDSEENETQVTDEIEPVKRWVSLWIKNPLARWYPIESILQLRLGEGEGEGDQRRPKKFETSCTNIV